MNADAKLHAVACTDTYTTAWRLKSILFQLRMPCSLDRNSGRSGPCGVAFALATILPAIWHAHGPVARHPAHTSGMTYGHHNAFTHTVRYRYRRARGTTHSRSTAQHLLQLICGRAAEDPQRERQRDTCRHAHTVRYACASRASSRQVWTAMGTCKLRCTCNRWTD